MDKKNLMPQAAGPINRTTTGQLPAELAQLSEEALQLQGDEAYSASVLPHHWDRCAHAGRCSYDGDDAE
jgi:bacteriocin leader peptide (microcyclamide/patellamide family)